MKKIINLNSDWRFSRDDIGVVEAMKAKGTPVNIPHTWNNIDGQDGGNDYYRGTCWYTKTFTAQKLDLNEKVWLEFRGVAMSAVVYINGNEVKRHDGGYSTFRVEITKELTAVNTITISVDNSDNDRVYPQKADFTFYGGIYRDVNMIITTQSHFALEPYGTTGLKVTPKINGKNADIIVEADIVGEGQEVLVTIDKVGTVLCQVINQKAVGVVHIEDVHLWDGLEDPYLYYVKAELLIDGKVIDEVSTYTGCRTFAFDKEHGFYLNGRSYPLRGVARHQDHKGVGNALTKEMHHKDMELIQEVGANTIRLAHYQHDQYFYDLCDRAGMIVWAEIPYITKHMPNGRENTLSQMAELVTQCYNHPSIICWGLSNEITASDAVTDDLIENHQRLNDLVHNLDATRPTTLANVFMLEIDSPLLDIPDINAYNLYFGWYVGELVENNEWFDEFHEKYPDKIIGFSEYGADATIKWQTGNPDRGDYTEQYQAMYHEHMLKMIESRPYIWATHVWNMFEFAADGRDEGGENGINHKGLITFDRRTKKDAFYLYQAYWSKKPMLHICGSRYIDRVEEVTEVKVYTNKTKVSLYDNDTLIEEKEGNKVFLFQIPIKGEHRIVAKAGEFSEEIFIRKVSEPNKDYVFAKESIVNWFDKEELKPDYYSIKDTLGDIKQNPNGEILIQAMMKQASASRGDVAESTAGNPVLEKMMNKMTVEGLLKQAGDAIKPEQVRTLNETLQKIKK